MHKSIYILTSLILSIFVCNGQNSILIHPKADAIICSGSMSSINFGSQNSLDVASIQTWDVPNPETRSLIKFDFSQIPDNAVIESATLLLYNRDNNYHYGDGSDSKAILMRCLSHWVEEEICWNNQPMTIGFDNVPVPFAPTPIHDLTLDITKMVQGWVNKDYPNYGFLFRLISESVDAGQFYQSREGIDKPELRIVYNEPEPPGQDCCDASFNWVENISFNESGKPNRWNRTYYNNRGLPTQTQLKVLSESNVIVGINMYDEYFREVVKPHSAPTYSQNFCYKEGFMLNSNNENYSYLDFDTDVDNPSPVPWLNNPGTLNYYYSNNNNYEPYVHATHFPYSRIEYSEIQPGKIRRSSGAGEALRMGSNHETYVYELDASYDELIMNGYDQVQPLFNNYNKLKKTVNVNSDGKQRVSYMDLDGNILADCLVQPESTPSLQDAYYTFNSELEFPFIDFHISGNSGVFFSESVNPANLTFYDLKTEEQVFPSAGFNNTVYDLSSGFYRVIYTGSSLPPDLTMHLHPSYYNFAFYYYDNAGRLIKSLPPVGYSEGEMINTAIYNSSGQVLSSTSPDEGQTSFVYRKDGQIRFSQNAIQAAISTGGREVFSYTHYDRKGRPVESGVYDDPYGNLVFQAMYQTPSSNSILNIIETIGSSGMKEALCKDQTFVQYDVADNNLHEIEGIEERYCEQRFLAGRVTKIWNDITTTWYSYNELGRVEWTVQQIAELGAKTIEYAYDFNGNLLNVAYQFLQDEDQYEHHYKYNVDGGLTNVSTWQYPYETILNKDHARYVYYDHGPLKRKEIGKDVNGNRLQGIDYVYNINGMLKSINSPILNATYDPGQDSDDYFGMSLDYYWRDYERENTKVDFGIVANEHHNGAISSIRWNIRDAQYAMDLPQTQDAGQQWAYAYEYDERMQFHAATFGHYFRNTSLNGTQPNPVSNPIGSGYAPQFTPLEDGDYSVNVVYDDNGNIQHLTRNGYNGTGRYTNQYANPSATVMMDELNYHYDNINGNPGDGLYSNKLYHYTDEYAPSIYSDDLEHIDNFDAAHFTVNQNNIFKYNEIGQLIRKQLSATEFEHYTYDAYGHMTGIYKDEELSQPKAEYFYNAGGYRCSKIIYHELLEPVLTFYVRDNSGNIISIYGHNHNPEPKYIQTELPVYGSERIGILKRHWYDINYWDRSFYELSDHLGNVRTVLKYDGNDLEMISHSDYYPFGWTMPGRTLQSSDYTRFGYQGQYAERDPESGYNHFEARAYASQLGRWLTTDPAGQFWSPYIGMGNNPANGIDPDGRKWYYNAATNETVWKTGFEAFLAFVSPNWEKTPGGGMTYNFGTAVEPDWRGMYPEVVISPLTCFVANYPASGAIESYPFFFEVIEFFAGTAIISKPLRKIGTEVLEQSVKVAAKPVTRSLDDLSSLRGATWKEAENLIPKGWTRGPLKKGEGIKFVNPHKKGEQILLEKGWPGAKDPLHAGPYMKVSRNGQVTRIPLSGNPTLK